jgi:SAM-dependent methyltransferase
MIISRARRLIGQQILRRSMAREPQLQRTCPLCNATQSIELLRGDRDFIGLRTCQCERCGFLFTNPFYSDEVIRKFYAVQYRALFKGEPDASRFAARSELLRERARYYVRLLEQLGVLNEGTKSFLDLGCGEGTLLHHLRERRPELELAAVEPGADYRQFVSDRLHVPVYDDVRTVRGTFDVIVSIHVVEHVRAPLEFLADAARLLRPGGVMFVDVPDTTRYSGLADLHLGHCNHFTASTLQRLLAGAGLVHRTTGTHAPPSLPPSIYALGCPGAPADAKCEHDVLACDAAEAIRQIDVRPSRYLLSRLRQRLVTRSR